MDLVELTQLISTIDDKIFSRWQYFIAVVLALTGWLVSKKIEDDIPHVFSLFLIFGLIVFFIANGYAIFTSVEDIKAVENERRCLLIYKGIETSELIVEETCSIIDKGKEIAASGNYAAHKMEFYTPKFREYLLKGSAVHDRDWIWVYGVICVLTIILLCCRTSWSK